MNWINIEKISDLLITKGELYQIIKKRKLETDQIDGKKIEEEDINELIINNETEKFMELFDKVFSDEEEQLDSEDGFVQDLFAGIVLRIKEKLANLGSNNKSQLLNFIFKFVKEVVTKSNGEDKSSSAKKTKY